MVKLERIAPATGGDDPMMPRQRAVSVHDNGMGDVLRFDAERLRILVERHLLHTNSARARALLDDWDNALTRFVKVMPSDYARALADLAAERATTHIAAE
jgi:glutamate synthase (NADPH/NADH) large chain